MIFGKILSYILTFLIAFAVTYLLTPTVRFLALKFSYIDKKDDRKIHNKVVTRFGGIAIYSGFVFAMFCSFFIKYGLEISAVIPLTKIVIASSLILCLGLYDDVKGADAKIKFFVQILASFFLVNSGFVIDIISVPFSDSISLGMWGIPLTVLWLVGITNAINLIDGMDGLAGGIVFISALGLAIAFGITQSPVVTILAALALAGAVLAFLRYNFSPAKIFMGDTGSMFLGFTIASITIMSRHKATASIALLVPIIALGIPIVDTMMAFARRLIKGKNPFQADKKHIHHWLVRKDLSTKQAVWLLLGITFVLNIFAVIAVLFR